MKLLVGLGNIGNIYTKTKHNIGFMMMDFLVKNLDFPAFKEEKKFFGELSYAQLENEKIILLKPHTYMNLSGKSVSAVARFYKLDIKDIFVFFDDVDLPFGKIRFRKNGGSGGHNGIKSILESLGDNQFQRIKFGIQNDLYLKMDTAKINNIKGRNR